MRDEIRRLDIDDPQVGHPDARVRYSSDIWGWFVDGRLIMVWGVIPDTRLSDSAYLWSMFHTTVPSRRLFFLRAREVIATLREHFSRLYGFTDPGWVLMRHLGETLADRPAPGDRYYFEILK